MAVNPSTGQTEAAKAAVLSISLLVGDITIQSETMPATHYVRNNKELREFLAYFLKENVVWTTPIKQDRLQLLTQERKAIAELIDFLDSAPWLSQIATYDRRWAAIEFLLATRLIVFQVRDNVFVRTSRENENIRVPLFCLQPDPSVLPEEVERIIAPYRLSPEEAYQRRSALLMDLGPATPQIGPSNTGRLLESIEGRENVVIRQVMFSGRTSERYIDSAGQERRIDHKELIKSHGSNILIKLLILSPAATAPFDEGTWDTTLNLPGSKLKANLVDGLLALREMNQLDFRHSRLQVRLYGDKVENSLFRGLIVEYDGCIQAAQFCVWDYENQRGTHGEYGETTGRTNLARLYADYFDRAFSDSIPLYKRHYVDWVRDTFKVPEVAAVVCAVGFVVFLFTSKGNILTMGPAEWINLCGFCVTAVLGIRPALQRLRRLRQKSIMEWRKYNDAWLRAYRDEVKRERKEMDKLIDNLEIGYLRFGSVTHESVTVLSSNEIEESIRRQIQNYGESS